MIVGSGSFEVVELVVGEGLEVVPAGGVALFEAGVFVGGEVFDIVENEDGVVGENENLVDSPVFGFDSLLLAAPDTGGAVDGPTLVSMEADVSWPESASVCETVWAIELV